MARIRSSTQVSPLEALISDFIDEVSMRVDVLVRERVSAAVEGALAATRPAGRASRHDTRSPGGASSPGRANARDPSRRSAGRDADPARATGDPRARRARGLHAERPARRGAKAGAPEAARTSPSSAPPGAARDVLEAAVPAMPVFEAEALLDVAQLAKLLGLPDEVVELLTLEGKIPSVERDGKRWVSLAHAMAFKDRHAAPLIPAAEE
jgi:hypothetical protein